MDAHRRLNPLAARSRSAPADPKGTVVPSIHCSDLTFSYSSAEPVLAGVSLDLGPGWTGVVGANGAGKTTLLRLLAGELEPDSGSIAVVPPGARVVRCPQRVDDPDERVLTFAATWETAAARIRARLLLDSEDAARWDTLSPGERKRWQVGAALAAEPDVLVLDEPTNHLDADARRLLMDALAEHRGVGLIVSHDRRLLDELTSTTVRIRAGTVDAWSGGYTVARSGWEADEAARRSAHERAKAERRRTERRLQRARRERAAAEAGIKRERRRAGTKDSDARSMERKGRVAGAERVLGRAVEVLRDRLERSDARLASYEAGRDLGSDLRFDHDRPQKRWLASVDLDEMCAGPVVLARDVRLAVGREDRIRVTGPNGAGKTTLLSALVAGASIPDRRLVHLPQELSAEDGSVMLDAVRALPADRRGRLLQLVGVLGVDPERLLASAVPSPGEARKVVVAYGLATAAWLLVLDEPTNHLDLPSIERLEAALDAYQGALVIVTHDEVLARRVTDVEWRVGDVTVAVEPD
jgi:ATPase subunit of ABC transporter with duplicated ATPase domains